MKAALPALLAVLILAAAPAARAAVVTSEINYKDGQTDLQGYYAYDDAARQPLPGVIIIHEWWGNGTYERQRAEQLAALGYAAFAIDMYGKGAEADTPDKAKALSAPFYKDPDFARRRAEAGINALKSQAEVDGTKIAAVGYCFGGSMALELARGGEDLKGVVALHAGLSTSDPAQPGAVKARVLALNGGADQMNGPEVKAAFEKEMTGANVNFRSVDYPGALHAFSNPAATELGKKFGLPIAYDAEADKKSFAEEQAFLADVLR